MSLARMESVFKLWHSDDDIVVIEKKKAFLSQRADRGSREGIAEFVSRALDMDLRPVHRLDREVCGLMVLARTAEAAQSLFDQFKRRQVKKLYHAWVYGLPKVQEAELKHYLKKNPTKNHTTVFHSPSPGAKEAVLSYRVVSMDEAERVSLLEVELKTGRSHQIRAQLAKQGHSIVGDIRYRSKGAGDLQLPIQLRSSTLAFDQPHTGARLEFRLPLDAKKFFPQ